MTPKKFMTGKELIEDKSVFSFNQILRHSDLIVGLEGSRPEVDWMTGQLAAEWRVQDATEVRTVAVEQTAALWRRLVEFPAANDPLA